ncbi:fkbM_fam, methyltransferase, FkbM family [Paracoccaceae bacterium]|jgi:FkbM family methyltransferase
MHTLRRKLHLAVLRAMGREKLVFSPHGIAVQVPRDADVKLRYDLSRGRPYEHAEAEMITAHLKSGTPVIELGGCLGIVSALIRQQIGPAAPHIVVEANPRLARMCEPNACIGANVGATQVVVAAVDYSGAETVSFSSGRTAHGGHVSQSGDLSVQATTLSALASNLPEGPFALICDIEGAEVGLIDNESDLLRRVSLFVLETHPKVYAKGEVETGRLIELIKAAGLHQVAQAKHVYAFAR